MASVRQVEVNYPRDDIGVEGSVISKGQGIRHFQKLNPDLIVVSVNKFQMNWELMRIECSFTVKDKYADNFVTKEKFLEIMETNSNLMRDLEAANEKIAEYEKIDADGMFVSCDNEQLATCAAKYAERCEQEPELGGNSADGVILDEFAEVDKLAESVVAFEGAKKDAIVKHDEEFAKTQEALETTTDSEAPDGQ